jgi:hypothetical protein
MSTATLFRTTILGGAHDGIVVFHVHIRQPRPEDLDFLDELVEAGWTPQDSTTPLVDADGVAKFVTTEESVALATMPADVWAITPVFDAKRVRATACRCTGHAGGAGEEELHEHGTTLFHRGAPLDATIEEVEAFLAEREGRE